MSLAIVKPLPITDAMLTACDVPENDYAAWAAGTTYALGARVIVVATHQVYESLQAGNVGKDPTLAANAAWWIEVSPTNRWKLFDTSTSTQTSKAGSMSYTIAPGQAINAVAALNMVADSVRIRMTDPTAGQVYDKTISLKGEIPTPSWSDYFFATTTNKTQAIALDVPPYAGASVQVDVTANSGNASCGVLMMGYQVSVGDGIYYGADAGIQDYSRKETNQWGDTVLDQRAYADRLSFAMPVQNTQVDALKNQLTALRATPCLWVGYEPLAITTVFGFYKDFSITIPYANSSDCNLTIEGMT